MRSLILHVNKLIRNVFFRSDVSKTTKKTGFFRDGDKHVELCLDVGQSS